MMKIKSFIFTFLIRFEHAYIVSGPPLGYIHKGIKQSSSKEKPTLNMGCFKPQYQRFLSASDKTDDSSDVAIGINSHTTGSLQFLVREGGIGSFIANTNTLNYNDGYWHHFVATVDSSGNKVFVDGSQVDVTYVSGDSSTQAFFNTVNDLDVLRIGNNEDSGGNQLFTNGTIDEVKVYPYALTEEQIKAHYKLEYNKIVSNETERFDDYICSVTPNDGIVDGVTKNSSTLTIKNYPPDVVSLLYPLDGVVLGALPEFNWTESFDTVDYDDIYYYLQIDNDINFLSIDYTDKLSEPKDTNVFLDSTKIDEYHWRVLATDDIDNSSWSSPRTFNYSQWNITFNVTSGEDGSSLNDVVIYGCNYPGFDQAGDTTNMYGPYAFPNGTWQCTFAKSGFFNYTKTFTADNDKIVHITMPITGGLTWQEHTWLEALYNCIILKDCDLYNLLVQINTTVSNVWEHTKPTDKSVITSETQISNTYNSTQNISFNYIVQIPIKAGYSLGTYLPVRIGFWFMDESNETCYNQGTLPMGVSLIEPYCNPLMVEDLGPMGGSIDLRVNLRPNLSAGTYNIKRIIEIDPNNLWIGYGQEIIGQITVTEDMTYSGAIDLKKTGETNPIINDNQPQSSPSGSGGGGSSRVITQSSFREDSSKDDTEETPPVTNIYNTYIIQPEEEKEKGGLVSITGYVIGKFIEGLSDGSSLIGFLIMMVIVLGGLSVYLFIKKQK